METKIFYTKNNPNGSVYPSDFHLPGAYASREELFAAHPELDDTPPPPPPPTLEEANTAKYAEILAGANSMDAAIKARYSTPEIASFEQQRQGAEAIISDANAQGTPDSPVGLVRGLAAEEGVSATAFSERILFNVAQVSAATKAILMQQRGYEAALKKAATVEEVEAITVAYSLV